MNDVTAARLLKHINKEGPVVRQGLTACWIWTAYTNKDGYGHTSVGRKRYVAHRLAYETFVGPIPDGLLVMHRCDNPPCVNPEHLTLGTHLDNQRDKLAKGRNTNTQKTHCPQGHPYDAINTYVTSTGHRLCKLCGRLRALARNRAAGLPERPSRRKALPDLMYRTPA